MELHSKWRHLIPDQFQDEMCPKPDDTIIQKVKNEKAQKVKQKNISKKLQKKKVHSDNNKLLLI